MPAFLLATKLNPPPLRPDLVPRPQISQGLNANLVQNGGFARQLTLVSAPAGFGKTTVVAEWLHHVPQPVTWLTLDEHDNDPGRFLAHLIAALQLIDSPIGQTVQALLPTSQPPPIDIVLTSLINDINQVSQPFFLVLDDYHKVHNRTVHEQLSFILDHQPRTMHLVIVTREDPLLPVSRLRARKQVTELRQLDLRFRTPEIVEFFRRTARLDLPPAVITLLEDRTEGWAAGLQLAAISLDRQTDIDEFVRSFAGSNRYILDFLFDEVLSRQPPAVQDFLLRTSILDQLCGPLCDAVTGRTDSTQLLQNLEQNNLFVVPLDIPHTWYRYHHLFSDLLRHRLRLVDDLPTDPLHVRASDWYETEKQPFNALQHALAGRAWPRAAHLIGQLATSMLRLGQVTTLLGWLQALPVDIVRTVPELCYAMAWTQLLTGQFDQAEQNLACAEKLAGDNRQIRGNLLVAQAYLARVRGFHEQALTFAQEALQVLPMSDTISRGMVALNLGLAQITRGHLVEAEQALNEACVMAQAAQNHYVALTALSLLGSMQLVYGHLHDAAELCRKVLTTGGQLPPTAMAHSVMGALLYEWNGLTQAAEHLVHGVELCQITGNAEVLVDCLVTLTRVRLAASDRVAARAALTQAQEIVEHKAVSAMAAGKVAAGWTALALAENDLAAAQYWAARMANATALSLVHARIRLVPVVLLVAQKRHAEAAAALQPLWESANEARIVYLTVDIRVLQAISAPSSLTASRCLQEALVMAEPEGYVRTFVDKGAPIEAMLQELQRQGFLSSYVKSLLAAFDTQHRYTTATTAAAALHQAHSLVEPLTEREFEILHLVADGLSNEQIADRLFITVGTVKTHLHRIYGKLDVQSRTQAVARARAIDLL